MTPRLIPPGITRAQKPAGTAATAGERLGVPFLLMLVWLGFEYGRPSNPFGIPLLISATLLVGWLFNKDKLLVTLPTVVSQGMTGEDLSQANVFFPYFAGMYGVSKLLSLHRAYNRTIMEVGRQERVDVVDLAGAFEALPQKRPYFWDTMHPNEKGNVLIAEILAVHIRARGHGSHVR